MEIIPALSEDEQAGAQAVQHLESHMVAAHKIDMHHPDLCQVVKCIVATPWPGEWEEVMVMVMVMVVVSMA